MEKRKLSKETKKKISLGLMGRPVSIGTRKKLSESNKGKHFFKHTLETRKKMSLSRMGHPTSKETRKKLSIANKGHIPWLKGKFGIIHSPFKGVKRSRDIVKRMLRRRKMSSLEIKFNEIVKKNKLPYKFVGNGKFFIENKNPDFINTNGEKIAIEVFHTKHKEQFRVGGVEEWKREREKLFNKYGWKIIYFNQVQINEENILNTI
jgi:very-short-patch-repair endonuclease